MVPAKASGRVRAFFFYRSIRFRLASIFVAIFGTTLVLFSVLLYQVYVRSHQNDFDAALFNHAVDVARAVDIDFFGDLSVQGERLATGSKIFPFSLGRAFLQIRNLDGRVMGRSANLGRAQLPFLPEDAQVASMRGALFRTIDPVGLPGAANDDASSYRMINYLIDRPQFPKLILQIAVPMTFLDRDRASLLTFLLVNIPLTLIVAMLGGLFLSRRALGPVSGIIEKAQAIGATQLSERVPVPPVRDEIQALALTLNDLLDRLQRAFESQERFVADASHQLKTPLSILRGEIDLMRSRDRTPEEIREFMASASQEIDHLSKTVQDLLILARVDAGNAALSIQKVRLDEVVLEEVSRLERLAFQRGIRIRIHLGEERTEWSHVGSGGAELRGFEMQGDPDLLGALFHNLIENAIKYSSDGGNVNISVEEIAKENTSELEVRVEDDGPGIPESDLEKVFHRFYRVSSSKSATPGAGLGLAIARRIAEVHGGSILAANVDTKPSGARFTVRIKKF